MRADVSEYTDKKGHGKCPRDNDAKAMNEAWYAV